MYGTREALLTWIQNLFTGRTHRTKLDGHVSDIAQLISGVVQGSGIGLLRSSGDMIEVFQILTGSMTLMLPSVWKNIKFVEPGGIT